MDFIFISMPYAKFDSKWFANVPNINLGILEALLRERGKAVKTFHFHLDFLSHLKDAGGGHGAEGLLCQAQQYGVEYMGLDYVFASLLFEPGYHRSRDAFVERLDHVGLSLDDFETLRQLASTFVEQTFSQVSPYLKEARLVGFSCSHYQLSASLLMAARIKKAYPHVLTVFGGKDVAGTFGTELMRHIPWVDYVGFAECEITVAQLLSHIDDPNAPLYNVLYRDKNGRVKRSPYHKNLPLTSLPLARYDVAALPLAPSEIILPIELGRGCPWKKCTFCPDASYNIRCQSKSADQVQAEIEYYRSAAPEVKNFIILDSDALKDPDLVIALADYLDGRGLLFHFAEFRAEKMDKKVLEALSRFGSWVTPFQVGIETFSERVLRLMKKGVSVQKNVEVIKMVAELGIPLQFNLFTCYPKMTMDDYRENIRVMDLITHLLVCDNIDVHPGEFYLPTDCPVFLDVDRFGVEKGDESIFSEVFCGLPMPSYSNYPYPYAFSNDEEQYQIATMIRNKAEVISETLPDNNFMYYENNAKGIEIVACRDGRIKRHHFGTKEAAVYMAAIAKFQKVNRLAERLSMDAAEVAGILDGYEENGLILYASDRKSFLSLATAWKASSSA